MVTVRGTTVMVVVTVFVLSRVEVAVIVVWQLVLTVAAGVKIASELAPVTKAAPRVPQVLFEFDHAMSAGPLGSKLGISYRVIAPELWPTVAGKVCALPPTVAVRALSVIGLEVTTKEADFVESRIEKAFTVTGHAVGRLASAGAVYVVLVPEFTLSEP
jgi:hypothetical protein